MKFECRAYRKTFSPEEWEIIRKWEMDPNMPSGKDMMYNFLRSIGEDVQYGDVFNFE